jgi:hypothetical protein
MNDQIDALGTASRLHIDFHVTALNLFLHIGDAGRRAIHRRIE